MEEFVSILLCREYPHAQRIKPGQGDGGIDIRVPDEPGRSSFTIYQVKKFSDTIDTSERSQIKKSVERLRKTVSETGLAVSELVVAFPSSMTPNNDQWFTDLTANDSFKARWAGRDFLEGLASKYPDVVDYFVGNGRERAETALYRMATLLGAPGVGASPGASMERIQALADTLNACDPLYSYELQTAQTQEPPRRHAAGLVFSDIRGNPGQWTAVHVFARMDESANLRPVTLNLTLTAKAGTREHEKLEDFIEYGTPLVDADAIDIVSDAPGGLGGCYSRGQITSLPLTPHRDQEPTEVRLEIVKPSSLPLAGVNFTVVETTQSLSGTGRRRALKDPTGLLTHELRVRYGTTTTDWTFSLKEWKGGSPAAMLPLTAFIRHLHCPNILIVKRPYGIKTGEQLPIPSPAEQLPIPSPAEAHPARVWLHTMIEALSTIQERVTSRVFVPELETLRSKTGRQIAYAAKVMREGSVTSHWTKYDAQVTKEVDWKDVLPGPITIVIPQQLPIGFRGALIDIGSYVFTFTDAAIAPDAEPPHLSTQMSLVPNSDDTLINRWYPVNTEFHETP
ncbi:hypothetical protein AS9A_P20072 (plasmid) [Hoyosella subflava DQS3-9A1]|uniref:Restriction endonuclease type IV Mrr domain-containing protein n=1 Tax=Hoyosella subflava (strain DSM 45089 / JCM 17490 / NBRC 109087 / DQS3-9A1) TaxID=443218 RepID=F6ESJ5_HOYSD|nr:hypothetical protein AS9A_P20072 [Hoyosella subflava DQS3-9A1]